MATFKVDKVVSALPATLVPDTIYAVRVGTGFDLYFTDQTGAIAHTLNSTGTGLVSQTFFAEENASPSPATAGGFHWAAGDGADPIATSGVVCLLSGLIKEFSLQIEGTSDVTVELYVNGTATGQTVSVTGGGSSFVSLSHPVSKGDVVNFATTAAAGTATSGRVSALLVGNVTVQGEVISAGATDGQVPVYNSATEEYEPADFASPATVTEVSATFAAGSTLGLQQELLANSGQPGLTVLAVGFTTSGKVQGTSLGDGNVVEVYASGADFNSGTVLYREFMSLGEPICFTGLSDGAIITATQGFYGFSEQVDGADESPMPLLSYGLSFKSTFFFAFRNSNVYAPGAAGANQGWIHVVNGPLESTVRLANGTGVTVQGQEDINLAPWEYYRLYTAGNQEYILEGTNPIMACHAANMDLNPTGSFYDSRLIMPLTNDGITWPRSGQISASYDNTQVAFFVRDGAEGFINSNAGTGVSPGAPVDFDAAIGVGTGASDPGYQPNGATRVLATGLVSAFSGADTAGFEASPLMPTSAMSQVVAQPLTISGTGSGGSSGVAIASPYAGTAKVYEWNTTTLSLDLAYTVPLTRSGVTVTSKEDQKHPAAGLISNDGVASNTLVGQLKPGVIIADVPITVVVQNGSPALVPTIRSQNGTTTTGIISQSDETLSLGITPNLLRAEIVEGQDGILYKRNVTAGPTAGLGEAEWVEA